MNLRQRCLVRLLAKGWVEGPLRKDNMTATGNGYVEPNWLASAQAAFNQPFSKHEYNPSFGDAPGYLGSQINRALNRADYSPNQVQAQINTTTEKVVGTTTTAASGAEPVGFGGGGNTGTVSRQLGHSGAAGSTTLAAPEAAPAVVTQQSPAPTPAAMGMPMAPPPVPGDQQRQSVFG